VIVQRKSLGVVLEQGSLFLVWLSIEVSWSCPWARKSLSCVIEHRRVLELSLSIEKSLTWVFEQLVIRYYILVELSSEVQGRQDYFRFVEGTCIIACVLSFSVLLLLSAALRLWTQVRLWTISDSESGNSFSERKKEKFLKTQFNPPSCGFSNLQAYVRRFFWLWDNFFCSISSGGGVYVIYGFGTISFVLF